MKKILILLAIVLFTINTNAQENTKKESSCHQNESHAKMTSEEITKCEAKCKAEGKVCTAKKESKSEKKDKKCCSKA